MTSKKTLETIIQAELKKEGYKKNNSVWSLPKDDTVLIVSLQKSNWGEQYYVNVGVYIKSLSEPLSRPKDHDCHILIRLSLLSRNLAREYPIEKALDFEDLSLSADDRATVLSNALSDVALPTLSRLSSLDGIRDSLTGKFLTGAAIRQEVHAL